MKQNMYRKYTNVDWEYNSKYQINTSLQIKYFIYYPTENNLNYICLLSDMIIIQKWQHNKVKIKCKISTLMAKDSTQTCAMLYILLNVFTSLKLDTLNSLCTEESSVMSRQCDCKAREELGCSYPSCFPETIHQWTDLVLHISKTRSIVHKLQFIYR